MGWIKELENQIYNENTIVKSWKTEQFINLFKYLSKSGMEEFAEFSSEAQNLSDNDNNFNFLRMIEFPSWNMIAPTMEKWHKILARYPNIKDFLSNNSMLDRRMLCSNLYYDNLFKGCSKNLAETFLENMIRIKYLQANVCWFPLGICPFSKSSDFNSYSAQAIYDITEENERLIYVDKYYCGLDLEYYFICSRFMEKSGKKYRQDIYLIDYKKELNEQGHSIRQTACHGWILRVSNNGENIKKNMALQGFHMTNSIDGECHNLPSLAEIESFDLPNEMKKSKIDEQLIKQSLQLLTRKRFF